MRDVMRRAFKAGLAAGLMGGLATTASAGLPVTVHVDSAASAETGPAGKAPAGVLVAQGSCSSAAAQAASQSGGQVLSVTTAQQGGRTVCIVTVLVPGRDGSRPRRVTITIPQ